MRNPLPPERAHGEALRMPVLTRLTYAAQLVVLTTAGLYFLGPVLMPLFFALILAIMVHPLVRLLERTRMPRALAIILVLILTITVLGGLLTIAISQITAFRTALPGLQDQATNLLEETITRIEHNFHIERKSQLQQIRGHYEEMLTYAQNTLASTVSTTFGFVGSASLVLLYMFFLLYYRHFFRTFTYKVFRSTSRVHMDDILRQIYAVVQNYLVGLLLVMGIVAVLDTVGLLIVGASYAIFFAVSAALLMVIPYIGMLSVTVVATLVTLVTAPSPVYAVGTLCVMLGVQTLEGNFITPYVVGSKVSVNPFIGLVVLVLGELLWGIGGMILALPITAMLKVIFDEVPVLQPLGYLLGSPEEGPDQHRPRPKKTGLVKVEEN